MAIPIGDLPGLEVVVQDPQRMAAAFQNLLELGSTAHMITRAQLRIVSTDATVTVFTDIAHAVRLGTRFFDAICYFLLPANQRPLAVNQPPYAPEEARNGQFIARRLFVLAFYLLTRGNVPVSDNATDSRYVPAILRNIFGVNYSPNNLIISLGDVPVREFDHQWISAINWDNLSPISKNRFGLGVAGYRLLAPFKMFPREDAVQNNQAITLAQMINAYNVARALAQLPYCWELHPITRSANVLKDFGPLNQNLENLMLACFTHELLTELNVNRTLFRYPVYNARARNYLNWDINNIPANVHRIFPPDNLNAVGP